MISAPTLLTHIGKSDAPPLPSLLQRRGCVTGPPLVIKQKTTESAKRVGGVSATDEFTLGERCDSVGKSWFHGVVKNTGQEVLVKVAAMVDPDRYMQLVKEFHLLQRLDCPGIVKALTCSETEENMMLVCEPLEGQSLFDVVSQAPGGRLSETQAQPIFAALAATLRHLDEHGIVHGKISPHNIIVSPDGRKAVLINWGRALRAGECARRDQRDDAAFARCLHFALTGSPWVGSEGCEMGAASWQDLDLSETCLEVLSAVSASSYPAVRLSELTWLK
eukprot:TRINITY_DN3429_c0_g1_i1.p1 TRINITY_DN3429_c0_g1~~TRINITY_DN3429_c0_g1_i1.p1  ORF type:complete len:297 (-),score=55.89 TRINITY_DN3429_c0_g1_i1:458-1288(-)